MNCNIIPYPTDGGNQGTFESLTNNTEYTCPADGYMVSFFKYAAGAYLYISINGTDLVRMVGDNSGKSIRDALYVRKGTKIKPVWSGSDIGVSFVNEY